VVLGSVAGSILGAKALMAVPNDRIRTLFAVVLVLLAVQMLLTALHVHLPWGPA